MSGTCGNARPLVSSSARVGRKRGFTNACPHCDLHEYHSGDSSCRALVCLRHLDEFHGGGKHSGCIGGEGHSGSTFGEFCQHFSSCIPVLEYADSNLLHDVCRLAWDAKFFLPGSVLVLANICRDSASWPAVSQTKHRVFVFQPGRVCQRIRRCQCPPDSREANLREASEPPGILAGPSGSLVSDVHLGHVRGRGFMQRIVHMLLRLRPDVVFITGDLFDGTSGDLKRVAKPWVHLAPPLGAFFVAGNHEEFSGHAKYLDAVRASGIRVLDNEKVSLDGLDLVGVHHGALVHSETFRSILRKASLDPKRPSILLAHAPDQLQIAEEEGISLQLSGHTHRGQFFPWTWVTSRIYGPFVYGLKRIGRLLVYTTSGAGTWGPPMRLGAAPELVLIYFES